MGLFRDWMHMGIEYYVEEGQPKEASEMPTYTEHEEQAAVWEERGVQVDDWHIPEQSVVHALRQAGYICNPAVLHDERYYTDIRLEHGHPVQVGFEYIVRHGACIETVVQFNERLQQELAEWRAKHR